MSLILFIIPMSMIIALYIGNAVLETRGTFSNIPSMVNNSIIAIICIIIFYYVGYKFAVSVGIASIGWILMSGVITSIHTSVLETLIVIVVTLICFAIYALTITVLYRLSLAMSLIYIPVVLKCLFNLYMR